MVSEGKKFELLRQYFNFSEEEWKTLIKCPVCRGKAFAMDWDASSIATYASDLNDPISVLHPENTQFDVLHNCPFCDEDILYNDLIICNKEIERKWILPQEFIKPSVREALGRIKTPINIGKTVLMEQYYLKAEKETELRLRRATYHSDIFDSYRLTFKVGTGLERTEEETVISNTIGQELIGFIPPEKRVPIRKKRTHCTFMDGMKWTIDEFLNLRIPRAVIEIEFESTKEAKEYTPPQFFGEEVTENISFKNKNIWLNHLEYWRTNRVGRGEGTSA